MRRLRFALLAAVVTGALFAAAAAAFGIETEKNPPPGGIVGQPYSYQFMVQAGEGVPPFTWKVSSGGLPPGLGVSSSGLLSGTPTQPGSFSFYMDVENGCCGNHSQRQFTINVVVGLAVQQSSLNGMTTGTPFSQQLTASGGGTQTWSVVGGSLPAGLAFATNGLVSGTPTTPGPYSFTVRVSDGSRTDDQSFSGEVVQKLVASAPPVPSAVVGSTFSLTLNAQGGKEPRVWAIKAGSVWPRGLSAPNPSTGAITGKPKVAGTYQPIVTVTDALGNVAEVPLAIVVNPRLKIPLQVLPAGTAGRLYRGKVTAKGGAKPLTFEVADGDLPRGVRLNVRTGALTGKPRLKGRYGFAIVVADQLGNTHQRSFVIRVR